MSSLVETLNERARGEGLVAALDMAHLILRAFFDGDPVAWRDQGSENSGFRDLLHHEGLEPSATAIWYALGVYEQCIELPSDVAGALSLAHHRALLPVDDADLKLSLARKAVRYGWSKRRLIKEIRSAVDAPARGRPRTPAFVKAGRTVRKSLASALAEPFDADMVERFGVRQARLALRQLRADLSALQELVDHIEECVDEQRSDE